MDKLPPAYVSPMSKRSARGQSLVELALTLPLLLLITVGILDLGRLYFAYMTVTNAARVGARYAGTYPNATDIPSHAATEAQGSGITIDPNKVTVQYPDGGPTSGNAIQVTVSYNFQLITAYIFGGGTIPLTVSNSMVIIGN